MRILLILLMLNFFGLPAVAGELVLAGVYNGTNVYISNPEISPGNFCITEVLLNNHSIGNIPATSAFEVNLSTLRENEPVVIKIMHKDGCEPKIINPNAIRAKSDFQFMSIDVSGDFIHWVAKGEKKNSTYFVEKFEGNEWIEQNAVDCIGNSGNNVYNHPASHHSGNNKYRIKYVDITGKVTYSQAVDYVSATEKITFYPKSVSGALNFSKSTKYTISDKYGTVVLKGTGEKVDCSSLPSGKYYVSFDNRTEEFFKK